MSRSDTRIVGDRSVTFRHQDSKMNEYWGDWSVMFRHQDSKENESWIMLIYSDLKNLFPKWVWCGGLSPHRCAWGCGQWFWYLLLSPVKCYGWFYVIIWYILLSILSWPMIPTQYVFHVLTPTCIFLLLFVECSKRAIDFDSFATLAILQHIRFQGELLFLARTGFFPSRLDVLKFGHGPSLLLILVS